MHGARRHQRFPLAGSATLRYELRDEQKIIHALISDISLGGIGLYLDMPLQTDTDVSVDITFTATDGTLKTESVEGRVVYSREINGMYFTGIEFYKTVNPSKHPFLHEHLLTLTARRFPEN